MEKDRKEGFFRNHADTMAIIGVNIAFAALIISLWLSNTGRIDAANARSDAIYVMIYDLIKEGKK